MAIHLTKAGLLRTDSAEDMNTEDVNTEVITSFQDWRSKASAWPRKRLVALWNELPGVRPVQKFTDREIALERIWRCIHPTKQAPRKEKEQKNPFREGSKAAQVYALLCRENGATAHEMQEVTGWQRHSVRGFLSASVRKQGYRLRSFTRAGERVYRLRS